jgi:hypothetical protein
MSMSYGGVLQLLLGLVLGVLGPVIGFILVATRGRGRPRTLGMIGFAAAGAIGILSQLVSRFIVLVINRMALSPGAIIGIWGVVSSLIGLIPMIILALAIIANQLNGQQSRAAAYDVEHRG